MATEIDKRVVEMQFDNKNFEKNCQASLTTLEKLKMALNFDGAKGLESMARAADKIDLSHLSKAADEVTVKFSAMNVAAMTAISEMTKGLINFGKQVWANTFGQIKTGGMARTLKIEQAMFQMKALAGNMYDVEKEAEKIDLLLDKMGTAIDNAVTGTAYGYDAAAAVAAQLMASGLQDADEMEKHLRAIAGAAAMTGRSFEDMGNIFTTVASNGKLMMMQVRQFSNAGMNLSAVLANKLNTTEQAINQAISKGLIDFQTFSEALYDSFGDAAGKADDTFAGVTSNIKAQLSRIGQLFTDPFVKYIIPVLKDVKQAIRNFNVVLRPIANTWTKLFKYMTEGWHEAIASLDIARLQPVADGVQNILVSLVMIAHTIKEAFTEAFPKKSLDQLHEAAMEFDTFARSLIPAKESLDAFKEALRPVFYILSTIFNIAGNIVSRLIKPVFISVYRLAGAVMRLFNALKPITDMIFGIKDESGTFVSILDTIAFAIISIVNALTSIVEVLGVVLKQISNSSFMKGIVTILKTIGYALGQVIFYSLFIICNLINDIFSMMNNENLMVVLAFVESGLSAIAGILQIVANSFVVFLRGIAEGNDVIKAFVDAFKKGVENFREFLGWGTQGTKKLEDAMSYLIEKLKELYQHIKDIFAELTPGKVILVGFAMVVLMLVLSIKGLVDASTGLVKSISSGLNIFTDFKKAMQSVAAYKPVVQIILSVTLAFVMFTSALMTLADADHERVLFAAKVLGAFTIALMGFAIVMQKLQPAIGDGSFLGMSNVATTIGGMAIAISLLGRSLMQLASVNITMEQAIPIVGSVIALLMSFAAAVAFLSLTTVRTTSKMVDTKKNIVKVQEVVNTSILTMLGLALSIRVLTKAIDAVTKIDSEKLKANFWALVAAMIAFSGSLAILGAAGVTGGAGVGALAFVGGIYLIVNIINKLATDFDYKKMLTGLGMMGSILGPILGFVIALGLVTKKMGGYQASVASTKLLNGIVKAVLACTAAVIVLGLLPESMLEKGLAGVSMLTLIFSLVTFGLLKVLEKTNRQLRIIPEKSLDSLAKIIKKIGECMILLGIATVVFSFSNGDGAGQLAIAFAGLGILLNTVAKASQYTEKAKIGPIIAIMTGIVSLMGLMALLVAMIPNSNDMIVVGSMITELMLGMAMVMVALRFFNGEATKTKKESKNVGDTKTVVDMVFGVMGITMAISALVLAVGTLDDVNKLYWGLTILGVAIGGLLIVLGSIRALSNTKSDKTMFNLKSFKSILTSMAAFILSLGAFTLVLSTIASQLDGFKFLVVLGSVALIVYGLTKLFEDFSNMDISLDVTDFNGMVLGIVGMFAGMSLLIMAIAAALKLTENVHGLTIVGSLLAVIIGLAAIVFGISSMIENLASLRESADTRDVIKIMNELEEFISQIGVSLTFITLSIAALFAVTSLMDSINVNAIIAFATVVGLFLGSLFALYKIVDKIDIKKVGNSIAQIGRSLQSCSYAIGVIALSVAMVAGVSYLIPTSWTEVLRFFEIAILYFGALAGLAFVSTKLKQGQIKNLQAVAKSMVLATASIAIIAASIATISFIKITPETIEAINRMIDIMAILFIALGLMVHFNKDADPKIVLATAGAMVLACGSLILIAIALSTLARSMNGSDVEKALDTFNSILGKMVLIFTVIAIIGGVLGGIGDIGINILTGVMVLIGAFTVFALGVDLFADAIKKLSEAGALLSSITIDANKIKDNISGIIHGIVEGVKQAATDILKVAELLIVGIFAILAAMKIKAALEGGATVIAFLAGIAAALPTILALVSVIIDAVIEWCETDENLNKVRKFFSYIAQILVDVVLGVIDGILASIGGKVYQAYVGWKKFYDEEEKDQEMRHGAKDTMDNKAVTDLLGLKDDSKKLLSDLSQLSQEDKDYAASLVHNWYLLEDEQKTQMFDSFLDKSRKYSAEEYDELAKTMAHGMITSRQGLSEISDDFYLDLAEAINMPAESMAYLNTVMRTNATSWNAELQSISGAAHAYEGYKGKVEETAKAVEETSVEIDALGSAAQTASDSSGTLVQKEGEATEATEELGEAAKETKEALNSVEGIKIPEIPKLGDMFNGDKLKEKANEIGEAMGINMSDGMSDTLNNGMDMIVDFVEGKATPMELVARFIGQKTAESEIDTYEYYYKKGIETVGESGMQYWETLVNEHGEKIYASAEDYAQKMARENTKGINTSGEALMDYLGIEEDLTDLLGGEGLNSLNDYTEGMETLGTKTEETKSKLQEFKDGLKDSISSAVSGIFNEVAEEEIISPKEMLYRLTKNSMAIAEWARNISILAARGMSEGLLNELKDMGPEGADKVKSFVMMTDQQLQEANRRWSAASAMPDVLTKEITNSYKEAGFNASLGFKQGIDKKAADEAMRELAQNSLDSLEDELEINSPSRKTMRDGEFATQGFAKGVTSEKSVNFVKQAATAITNIFVNSMRNNLSSTKMMQFGQFSIQGLVQGFQKTFPTATNAISEIAKKIASIFPSEWQIKSPSKLFENFGFYAMAGLGKGFEVGTDETSDELNRDSDYILKSMKENLANALSNVSEDSVYHPTIQPVFDLSALDQGYNDIQSWFTNNPGLTLSGNIKNLTPTTRDAQDDQRIIDAIHEINNDDVVREITALRSDISELQTAMSNMRVVMNSKALVGQIVTDMDAALGNRVVKNQRGRY